jgi:DNA-binding transcriptional regulator YiaG
MVWLNFLERNAQSFQKRLVCTLCPQTEYFGPSKMFWTMTKKYKSDTFAAIHETMEVLHGIGAIDKQTMRQFEASCLSPVQELSPEEIKALRAREHANKPKFPPTLHPSQRGAP